VLGANGITVNGRTAADQAAGGTQISLDEAQAGDLIYYDNGNGIYHIAIYNGDGTVTHSSSSTSGVTVSDMNYSGNAAGAVRYW
jgi:cell wall-associated NlpC family hydrolase